MAISAAAPNTVTAPIASRPRRHRRCCDESRGPPRRFAACRCGWLCVSEGPCASGSTSVDMLNASADRIGCDRPAESRNRRSGRRPIRARRASESDRTWTSLACASYLYYSRQHPVRCGMPEIFQTAATSTDRQRLGNPPMQVLENRLYKHQRIGTIVDIIPRFFEVSASGSSLYGVRGTSSPPGGEGCNGLWRGSIMPW